MANYSKFEIEYYRSFQDKQTLHLAIPVPTLIWSWITFIVGENNSGKTTIMEGLFLQDEQKIRSSEKQQAGDPCFTLYDEKEIIKRRLTLVRQWSYTLKENPKIPDSEIFEIIASRRHRDSNASGGGSIEDIIKSTWKRTPRAKSDATQVSSILKDIEKDDTRYKKFIEFVQNVIPNFSSFAIWYEEHEFIEYINKEWIRHKSDFLGDWVISIIRILSHLFLDNGRPIIIDEPELSLHPLAQKKLFKVIAECSKKRQIIISTHSPYFVSREYIKNWALLNKITKHEDKKSEIHTLSEYNKYDKLIKWANWQQPFLMDIVAKEIFFNDDLLFVEWQEDVWLLRQETDIDAKVNLFGYGVRGKDAFEFALELASDLGIKKAWVILDAGKEELKIKEMLEKKFSDYKIVQWNKEDIRDKEKYESKEKNWYFDKKWIKKDEKQLDDYYTKINEINLYFSPSPPSPSPITAKPGVEWDY